MSVSARRGVEPNVHPSTDGSWPTPRRAWRPAGWLAALCVVVFGVVLLDVYNGGPLRRFDRTLADQIRGWGLRENDVSNTIGFLFSQTGGRGSNVAWVLALCIAALVIHRSLVPLLRLALGVGLLWVAIYPVKDWLDRSFPMDPRGDYLGAPEHIAGGFPSGHQGNAVLICSIGAWIAVDYIANRTLRTIVCTYAMLAPVISAIAVLVMNYHWLSDVIGGACVGIVLLWLLRTVFATDWGRRVETTLTFRPR